MPQQIVHMSLFFQSSLANISISKQVKWENCKMASKKPQSSPANEIKFWYLSLLFCSSAPLLSPVLTDYSCLCFCLHNEAFACYATILFILQVYQSNVTSKCRVSFSPRGKTYVDPLTLSERWQITWAGELALHVTWSMVPINGTEKNINNASPLTLRDRLIVHVFSIVCSALLLNMSVASEFIVEWSVWGMGQLMLYVNDGQMLKG